MRTHTVDYRKDRPNDRAWINRGFWVYNVPRLIALCRLLGHKPVVDGTTGFQGRPGSRWVACDRCGIRPDPQGVLDPALWDIGQPYDGEFLDRPIPVRVREQLAKRGHTARLGIPGHWPARPTTSVGGQLVIGRSSSTGISLKVGNCGSEQVLAIDFGITGLFHLYLHTEDHGRWLQRRLNPRGYDSRIIEVDIHHRRLYTKLWARRDEWSKTDPWWMHGSLRLDPRDRLFGDPKYKYEDVGDPVTATVRMPEGDDHQVVLKLQKCTHGRTRGRQAHSWNVHWESKAGIPVRNHDWKGNNTYASGVDVSADAVSDDRWVAEACAAVAAQCSRDRAHYNYTPTNAA